MVLRVAGLPVWVGPSDLVATARAVVGWTDEAVGIVAALPERVSTLLDEVDVLVGRVGDIATRVEAEIGRVDGVVDAVDGVLVRVNAVADGAALIVADAGAVAAEAAVVVGNAQTVAGRAGSVVEEATATSRTAGELLATYQPIAERAAPLAARFVDELSEAEVHAAIKLIDQLPQLTEHMETDIMPILATLDRVGPDVHELLDVLKDVRQAISGIPGFNFLRRRGEREESDAHD